MVSEKYLILNFISEIKKKKIFILPYAWNEDFPRRHISEGNWKLLNNMTIVLPYITIQFCHKR